MCTRILWAKESSKSPCTILYEKLKKWLPNEIQCVLSTRIVVELQLTEIHVMLISVLRNIGVKALEIQVGISENHFYKSLNRIIIEIGEMFAIDWITWRLQLLSIKACVVYYFINSMITISFIIHMHCEEFYIYMNWKRMWNDMRNIEIQRDWEKRVILLCSWVYCMGY